MSVAARDAENTETTSWYLNALRREIVNVSRAGNSVQAERFAR
jgi:hypothetical protein